MSEARWKAKFTVASRVKREVCKRRRREDDKRKIRKGMDLSRERIASFHPSLKYASICTSPPLANRGSVFPISRERRVYEDLRATPARPVNSWREGGREGEGERRGMVKNGVTSNIPNTSVSRILSAILS